MPVRNPVAHANELLEMAAKICPVFLIAASGGKDSNVCFHLAGELRRRMPELRIGAYFKYVVEGLECVETPILSFCRRYGDVPLFKLPSPVLIGNLRQGHFRNPSIDSLRVPDAREKDIEWMARCALACHLSGIPRDKMFNTEQVTCPQCAGKGVLQRGLICGTCWRDGFLTKREVAFDIDKLVVHPAAIWTVAGHRCADGLTRRGWMKGFRNQRDGHGLLLGGRIGYDIKFHNVYPIAEWSDREVYAYVRHHRLPAAAKLGRDKQSGVNIVYEESMVALARNYPRDFAKVVREFPLIKAQIVRAMETEQ